MGKRAPKKSFVTSCGVFSTNSFSKNVGYHCYLLRTLNKEAKATFMPRYNFGFSINLLRENTKCVGRLIISMCKVYRQVCIDMRKLYVTALFAFVDEC